MIVRIETADELRNYFDEYGRDYFSDDGYEFLLEYYEDDYELDVIEVCGTFTEYEDLDELIADFSYKLDSFEDWCGQYNYIYDYAEENNMLTEDGEVNVDDIEDICEELYDDYAEEYERYVIDEIEGFNIVTKLYGGSYMIY